jgi:hypothetical protein
MEFNSMIVYRVPFSAAASWHEVLIYIRNKEHAYGRNSHLCLTVSGNLTALVTFLVLGVDDNSKDWEQAVFPLPQLKKPEKENKGFPEPWQKNTGSGEGKKVLQSH